MSFSSCADWLTLLPLNDVVLENYWTDKSDVESVLLGAYAKMESQDCLFRMSMWGEMRSDNIIAGSSTRNAVLQITKDNILETNTYTSWKCFYDAINSANTILHFAPIVAEKDPNYTVAELNANIAEAIAIRSLCYWYLIRAYKDVPFVTEPSIDDTGVFIVPAEKFDVILDRLIDDLEGVKMYAVNKYVLKSANTARFTRVGIMAMLADMYLWKGEWDKCSEVVDEILTYKRKEYEEIYEEDPTSCDIEIFREKYPLISNVQSNVQGNAYNKIFGQGNSFETLFELSYDPRNNSDTPMLFIDFYGNTARDRNRIGELKTDTRVGANFAQGTNTVFESKYDGRFVESIQEISGTGDFAIRKYIYSGVSYKLNTGEVKDAQFSARNFESSQSSWIIYRLTDVMLMQAEANAMKAHEINQGITSDATDPTNAQKQSVRDSLILAGFNAVQTVNFRAKGYNVYSPVASDTIKFAPYNGNPKQLEDLILKERRREFLFEGKRWFDLVRMSLREGNTDKLSTLVLVKYTENVSAVRIKLADMDAMFFPISKDERKINTLLKQNPAYEEDEFIDKSK